MTTPIISPLPANILAGQAVSAAPVMANFNWIVQQVNANVPAPYTPPTLSRVMLTGVGATNLASTVPFLIGKTASGIVYTKAIDVLGEFSTSTGLFTATNAGLYLFLVNAMGLPNGSTITDDPKLFCQVQGSNANQPSFFCFVEGHTTFDTLVASNFLVASLLAGQTMSATAVFTFTSGPAVLQYANLSIIGL